jgi:glycosyltransferase involved in cell wall biosynthesis
MRTVGISNRTRYWQQYVFSHAPEGYRYRRMVDIPWHALKVRQQFLAHTKLFLPLRRADLYHTYNSVVANRAPWVVEVESRIPRYDPWRDDHALYRWGSRRLASRDCRALIFTSQQAMGLNRERLVAQGVDPAKMTVVYRAVESYEPVRDPGRPFTILFAGNAFYRKGGVELLKAFQRLGRSDARLVIISRLEVDWGPKPDAATIAWTKRSIADDPRIELLGELPHRAVVERMRRADVFVATTFADPFNNTILEAMGTGCPVIVSRMGSIPEMVDEGRNAFMVGVDERESDDIAGEVEVHLRGLMDDTALRERMGKASLEVVRERFSIAARNARLKAIYDRALA